jgi:hypothetical protein
MFWPVAWPIALILGISYLIMRRALICARAIARRL